MSFIDVRFPSDIAYGSGGGPEYSTDVVITQGGYEQRNANWQESRARYNVAHGVKNQQQLDVLIAFFRARQGKAHGFRFKDWSDYTAQAQEIGVGDGSQTDFQLLKAYLSGGVRYKRTITKPVENSVVVYLDGVSLSASAYSVNVSTGVVSLNSAPDAAVVVTADFEFDIPARFDTDRLSTTLDSYGSHSWNDIPIVEIRT